MAGKGAEQDGGHVTGVKHGGAGARSGWKAEAEGSDQGRAEGRTVVHSKV